MQVAGRRWPGPHLPNTVLPMIDGKFSSCSWNARALCCRNGKRARAKCGKVFELSKRFLVICLVETHATEEDLRTRLRQVLITHELVFHSELLNGDGIRNTGGGGIALLIDKRLLQGHVNPPPLVFASGRLGKVTINQGSHNMFIYPTHNFDISSGDMKRFEDSILADIGLAKADPLAYSVLLLGDFNLEPKEAKRIAIPRPSAPSPPELVEGNIFVTILRAKRWGAIFDRLTEVCTSSPTHFNSAQLYLNLIDRVFISLPRSSLCLFHQKSGIIKDPVDWFVRGLSDHSPIFWELETRISKPQSLQRVLPEWCEHPVFVKRFKVLYEASEIPSFSLPEQNVIIKDLIKDCAKHARDAIFESDPLSPNCKLLRFSSISRAVYNKDVKLARTILEVAEDAHEHLALDAQGLPSLKNPENMKTLLEKPNKNTMTKTIEC